MRIIICFVTLLSALVAGCISSRAQDQEIKFSAFPAETIKVSDITWKTPFGYQKEETNNLYLPVTQGLVLTPQSTNFVSLIDSWLANHANAEAIVIYRWDDSTKGHGSMKSIWIMDGEDCLNVYLVRMGSCPAFTMLLNLGDKTPLTQKQYEIFAKKILEAEVSAKQNKLGIWDESRNRTKPHA